MEAIDHPGSDYHGWYSIDWQNICWGLGQCWDARKSTYYIYWISAYKVVSSEGKGTTSYGTVGSWSSSSYPSDGPQDGYWYTSSGSSTSYSKGSTQYSDVTSTDPNAYPNGSYSGSYWYDGRTSSLQYSMGSYIEDVFSTNPDRYPSNGLDGSFWYVYQGQL